MDKDFEGIGGNKEALQKVGMTIGKKPWKSGITEVVFDRSGYIYHGRIKELAEAPAKADLKF